MALETPRCRPPATPDGSPASAEAMELDACLGQTVGREECPSPKVHTAVPDHVVSLWSALPYVLAWSSSSMALYLYNKSLFFTGRGRFPYPVTLMLIHQGSLGALLGCVKGILPDKELKAVMPAVATRPLTRRQWIRHILPLAVAQASCLGLYNVGLKLASAHFVVMMGAFKPVLVALVQFAFGQVHLSAQHVKLLLLMACPAFYAVDNEAHIVYEGVIVLVIGQLTECVRLTLIHGALHGELCLDASSMLYYSAPCVSLVLLPAAYVFEAEGLLDEGALEELGLQPVLVSTGLAILVNMTDIYLMKKTDALMFVFTSIAKDFCCIFLSAWIFEADLAAAQVLGYLAAICVIRVYRELERNPALFQEAGIVRAVASLWCGMPLERPALGRAVSL